MGSLYGKLTIFRGPMSLGVPKNSTWKIILPKFIPSFALTRPCPSPRELSLKPGEVETIISSRFSDDYHPWKLTCPLKRHYFSKEYIFQPLIFRGHVSFQGGRVFNHRNETHTLQGTNISPKNVILKMIFLFPRWDMVIPWRVGCSITETKRIVFTWLLRLGVTFELQKTTKNWPFSGWNLIPKRRV